MTKADELRFGENFMLTEGKNARRYLHSRRTV
jgi:hypothetical protein